MEKRLERYTDEQQIGGVAAGLAHYFNIDRTLVRVLLVAGIFLPHFPAVIIYIILWVILPEHRFGSVTDQQPLYANPLPFMNSSNPNSQRSGNYIGGIILILLGVLFLVERYFDIRFRDLWPLILIAIGVWLLLKNRLEGPKPPYDSTIDSPPNPPTTY